MCITLKLPKFYDKVLAIYGFSNSLIPRSGYYKDWEDFRTVLRDYYHLAASNLDWVEIDGKRVEVDIDGKRV